MTNEKPKSVALFFKKSDVQNEVKKDPIIIVEDIQEPIIVEDIKKEPIIIVESSCSYIPKWRHERSDDSSKSIRIVPQEKHWSAPWPNFENAHVPIQTYPCTSIELSFPLKQPSTTTCNTSHYSFKLKSRKTSVSYQKSPFWIKKQDLKHQLLQLYPIAFRKQPLFNNWLQSMLQSGLSGISLAMNGPEDYLSKTNQKASQLLTDYLKNYGKEAASRKRKEMTESKSKKRRKQNVDSFINDDSTESEEEADFFSKDSKMSYIPLNKFVMLEGPVGCGKSEMIRMAVEATGSHVLEIHAGQKRSSKELLGLLKEATQSHSVHSKPKSWSDLMSRKNTGSQGSVIVIEDVDVLFQEDSSFWNGIMSLMTESLRPIILTCSENPISPSNVFLTGPILEYLYEKLTIVYLEHPEHEDLVALGHLYLLSKGYWIEWNDLGRWMKERSITHVRALIHWIDITFCKKQEDDVIDEDGIFLTKIELPVVKKEEEIDQYWEHASFMDAYMSNQKWISGYENNEDPLVTMDTLAQFSPLLDMTYLSNDPESFDFIGSFMPEPFQTDQKTIHPIFNVQEMESRLDGLIPFSAIRPSHQLLIQSYIPYIKLLCTLDSIEKPDYDFQTRSLRGRTVRYHYHF